MNAIRENLATATPDDAASLSDDEMLYTAVRLEFFMLDPVFSELIDLMGPGGTTEHRESYYRHVVRLIEAIETHHSVDSLSGFLAKVLLRAYRDQQRLAALTVRDQLTGLYNRRGLLNQLQQWLSWSARYDRPLALLLVDVDRFKSVNDTFGHLAGDEALKRVADGLRQGIRTSDILGRFGGDEFLILAPETDGTDLARLAQRILASIRSATILDAADAPTVTVSVGAAWVTGGTENVESLIAAADESLYEAKASGRNRTGAIKTPSPSA
jgi:diguanylate cyclase (GGDEF)-like protein